MTDAQKPAAHIEIIESSGAEYDAVTADASQQGGRKLLSRVVVGLLVIPYFGLVLAIVARGGSWAPVVLSAGVLAVLAVIYWAVNIETFRAAGTGLWRKSCRVVVEAEGQVTITDVYLVLRPSGVHIQTVSTKWFRAQFRTEYSFPWSSLITVELVRRGNRWRSVVISGPAVRIAPIGSVNQGFVDALAELGASPAG